MSLDKETLCQSLLDACAERLLPGECRAVFYYQGLNRAELCEHLYHLENWDQAYVDACRECRQEGKLGFVVERGEEWEQWQIRGPVVWSASEHRVVQAAGAMTHSREPFFSGWPGEERGGEALAPGPRLRPSALARLAAGSAGGL